MSKQQFPEPIVGALIINPKGELLLIRSHSWRDKWVIPGGHIELGERMEDALKREMREETNLPIYDIKLLFHKEFIYDNSLINKKHFIFFNYVCKTKNKEVKLNNEGQEYRWVNINKVIKLPIEKYTKIAIKKYIANQQKIKNIE